MWSANARPEAVLTMFHAPCKKRWNARCKIIRRLSQRASRRECVKFGRFCVDPSFCTLFLSSFFDGLLASLFQVCFVLFIPLKYVSSHFVLLPTALSLTTTISSSDGSITTLRPSVPWLYTTTSQSFRPLRDTSRAQTGARAVIICICLYWTLR